MDVPRWADVPAGTDWSDVAPAAKLDQWLSSMDVALDGWRANDLPADLRTDGSRSSLERLEHLLLERFPDWSSVARAGGYDFAERAARYIGRTLLAVCGGDWVWDDDPDSLYAGQPVIHPSDGTGLPIAPLTEVRTVVLRRTGTELGSLWDALARHVGPGRVRSGSAPGDAPSGAGSVAATPPGADRPAEPAELTAFRAARDGALSRWEHRCPRPTGRWDLQPGSLPDLAEVVLASGLSPAEFERPDPDTLAGLAARYLGETLIRAGGGDWHWYPGAPGEVIDPDDVSTMYTRHFFVGTPDPDRPDDTDIEVFCDWTLQDVLTQRSSEPLLAALRDYTYAGG